MKRPTIGPMCPNCGNSMKCTGPEDWTCINKNCVNSPYYNLWKI